MPDLASRPVAFACATDADLVDALAARDVVEVGAWTLRRFPDGESYCRVDHDVRGRDAVVVCRFDRPDDKLFGLLLAADALRDAGAARVVLVAPYLPYLRQDERFRAGEAISSRTLARVLRASFDGLLTIDPHLHRTPDLRHLFDEWPAVALASSGVVARYVGTRWPGAMVVGPDDEASQWVEPVADALGTDWTTLDKVRSGDRDVAVTGDGVFTDRDVVLLDDIISTGRTLVAAAELVQASGGRVVGCVATHALFADDAMPTLERAGLGPIVTATSVRHATNDLDIAPLLGEGIEHLLRHRAPCTTT